MTAVKLRKGVMQTLHPFTALGWNVDRTNNGHLKITLGDHRVGTGTTPSDHRSLLNLKRQVERCREGICQCPDEYPATHYERKKLRMSTTVAPPRIASFRKTEKGRILVRVIGNRAGRQTPYDIVLDPSPDSVWTGALLVGDGTDPAEVLADIERGEIHIGNVKISNLPLKDLRPLAANGTTMLNKTTTIPEAAQMLGVTPARVSQLMKGKMLTAIGTEERLTKNGRKSFKVIATSQVEMLKQEREKNPPLKKSRTKPKSDPIKSRVNETSQPEASSEPTNPTQGSWAQVDPKSEASKANQKMIGDAVRDSELLAAFRVKEGFRVEFARAFGRLAGMIELNHATYGDDGAEIIEDSLAVVGGMLISAGIL